MSSTVRYKHNGPDSEVETVNSTTPLMGDKKNDGPSLATPEIYEQDDNREVVTKPYPGVDDGFFDHGKPGEAEVSHNGRRSDHVEPGRRTEEPTSNNHNKTEDEHDGTTYIRRVSGSHFPRESDYSGHNHHHRDIEIDTAILEEIPDINVYQHKKTLAQGMMDLALFSANANQLRYVMDSFARHPYYYPSLIFICLSLLLQVVIGVLLIWNATYNVKDEKEVCRANKINNYTVIGIFLVTVVNVFVSAFGVADPQITFTNIAVQNNST